MTLSLKHPLEFEWDEAKSDANLDKHGLSFSLAATLFDNPFHIEGADKKGENRYKAIGTVLGRITTVVFTVRHEKIRIISARRARKTEEVAYRQLLSGESAQAKRTRN